MTEALLANFQGAYARQEGYAVASVLTPELNNGNFERLNAFHKSSNAASIQNDVRTTLVYRGEITLTGDESKAWVDLFHLYWIALDILLPLQDAHGRHDSTSWLPAYEAWNAFTKCLQLNFNKSVFPYWAVPCLEVGAKYLRLLAIKVDEGSSKKSGVGTYSQGVQEDLDTVPGQVKKEPKLAEAARTIMNIISTCSSDRAPIEQSRKWGLYAVANIQFKVYFQLNNMRLCKNLVRSLIVAEPPPLAHFPMADQVTFNYYMGVISFLEEDYVKAEEYLQSAWNSCHPASTQNKMRILTYLVSCRLITSHQLPKAELLAPYPDLASVFLPLASAIRRASLYEFDLALQAGETFFVKRRIYLTLERARDITLRNLFRKVYLAGDYQSLDDVQGKAAQTRRTRIPINEYIAAVRLSAAVSKTGEIIGRDEVECLLANMIYKNLIKGYIHRERAILVLSKVQPFPGTKP